MQADEVTATTVASQARTRGARPHVLDGTANPDRDSTLDAIARTLSFPASFSSTMDGLYDLLTDLSWLPAGEHVLIWVNSEILKEADPKAYLSIRGVLSDSQRAMSAERDRKGGHILTVVLADRH